MTTAECSDYSPLLDFGFVIQFPPTIHVCLSVYILNMDKGIDEMLLYAIQ